MKPIRQCSLLQVHVLVAGKDAKDAASSAAKAAGVDKVFLADGASVDNGVAEGITALISGLQAKNSEFVESFHSLAAVAAASTPLTRTATDFVVLQNIATSSHPPQTTAVTSRLASP